MLQVYDILNSLEDRLGVNNSAVVLAAMKVSWLPFIEAMSPALLHWPLAYALLHLCLASALWVRSEWTTLAQC
jgi:hypothetical protein